ncbi:MAG: hypothetical protein JNL67_13120 [Planctomycetaceae bacterium]|nr:hypothetical protein [Planctomycetaceae bacterium]
MPIATRCTHCGKAYQVAESTIGKQVKCQACGKNFVVSRTAEAVATPARTPGPTATSANADSAQRAKTAKMEAEFGLQPLPPNPNQVFPSTEYQRPRNIPNPLANHVVEDPGFEQISEADLEAHRKAEAQARHEASLSYVPVDDLDPESNQGGGVAALIGAIVGLICVVFFVLYMAEVIKF